MNITSSDASYTNRLRSIFSDKSVQVVKGKNSTIIHNFPPDKYGGWKKVGNSFVYQLNKKGRNRAIRKGEL